MITIELPESIAERILPILKSEHHVLEIQIRKIESSLVKSKDPSSAKNGAAANGTLPLMAPEKTQSGRAKKGESEKLITDYLKSLNGRKAAAKEISNATKTAYGSCLRVLRNLKDSGNANVKKRLWAWVGKREDIAADFAGQNAVAR